MPRHKQPVAPIHSPPLRPLSLVGKYFPAEPRPPVQKSYIRPPHDPTTPTASSRARNVRSSPFPPSPSRHRQSTTALAQTPSISNVYPSPCRPPLSERSSSVSVRQSVSPSPTPSRTARPRTAQGPVMPGLPSRPMYGINNTSTGNLGIHLKSSQSMGSRLPVRTATSPLHHTASGGNLLASSGKRELRSRISPSPTPPPSRSRPRYRSGSATPVPS
ncbi:hypothetical protein BOTBODRAFT_32160 [Botryobasidium botryosum FD-172 SS1]|uniref:Uncharacterized protein n=1 Tax=Botryobasidium botryosum (strain FD-172 SS1) TaxID=930990 RepID=A0A067MTC9_BOTB1|nr:hypothetical protein BOTBODRAFT_32160 [Botryobasidium botryosum FD-172 SS1]